MSSLAKSLPQSKDSQIVYLAARPKVFVKVSVGRVHLEHADQFSCLLDTDIPEEEEILAWLKSYAAGSPLPWEKIPGAIPNVTENLDLGPSQSPGAERSQLACIPNTGDVEIVPAAGAFASARNQIFSHVRYTSFQRSVYSALSKIPLGKTSSYGEIAASIGIPKGARAIGNACRANPFPLFVPCHRVVGANGQLGGFTPDLRIKKELLDFEGVTV